MASNLRPDIETLEAEYTAEMNKPVGSRAVTKLEKLVLAFDHIQKLAPDNHQSFFWLASYHGFSNTAIFNAQRAIDPKNGIYCAHGIIDFVAWHRPYLVTVEKALKSYDPSVSLPYWNEISDESLKSGIPWIFQSPQFTKSDGTSIKNSLYSYTYQLDIDDFSQVRNQGDTTVKSTRNIANQLKSTVLPEVKACLKTPNYNTFAYYNGNSGSVEEPHNNAHGIIGGNSGDMSQVVISSFDPIFYFHHCFYDHLFWSWQKKNNLTKGPLLSNDRFLVPWRVNNTSTYYSHNTVADIGSFGYSYPDFDFEKVRTVARTAKASMVALRGAPPVPKQEKSRKVLTIRGIDIQKFGGSFGVHAYAKSATGQKYDLGFKHVFHARGGCDSCDILNLVTLTFNLKAMNAKEEGKLLFRIVFKMNDGVLLQFKHELTSGFTEVKRVLGTLIEISY